MGAIRLLLAVAVVVSHGAVSNLYGFRFLSSALAVQAFFILSGFYMALVLDTTYRGPRSYAPFLANRALRLFPIYWLTCLITLALLAITSAQALPTGVPDALALTHPGDAPNLVAKATTGATNLLMLGQDAVHFFVATTSGIGGLETEGTPLYRFLLVPQAWTLSFELIFYAAAPLLVKWRSSALIVLTFLSLGLLAWLHVATDLMGPPAWEFKFLPAQAWTFTLGILAYRAYRDPRVDRAAAGAAVPALLLLGTGLLFGAYGGALMHRIHPALDQWLVLPAVVVLVPVAFHAFARGREASGPLVQLRRADAFLGDLSYAVYISHVMVYFAIYLALGDVALRHENHVTAGAVILSIGVSWLLVRIVHHPVERMRDRVRAKATMSNVDSRVAS